MCLKRRSRRVSPITEINEQKTEAQLESAVLYNGKFIKNTEQNTVQIGSKLQSVTFPSLDLLTNLGSSTKLMPLPAMSNPLAAELATGNTGNALLSTGEKTAETTHHSAHPREVSIKQSRQIVTLPQNVVNNALSTGLSKSSHADLTTKAPPLKSNNNSQLLLANDILSGGLTQQFQSSLYKDCLTEQHQYSMQTSPTYFTKDVTNCCKAFSLPLADSPSVCSYSSALDSAQKSSKVSPVESPIFTSDSTDVSIPDRHLDMDIEVKVKKYRQYTIGNRTLGPYINI